MIAGDLINFRLTKSGKLVLRTKTRVFYIVTLYNEHSFMLKNTKFYTEEISKEVFNNIGV